jgi:cytochrome c
VRGAFVAVMMGVVAMASPIFASDIGDPEAGEKVFAKCKGCHQVGPGAKNRIGPHLNNIFDRPAGGLEGFKYSKSMAKAGANGMTWDLKHLHDYLENPKALVSGTRMSFRGLDEAKDRDDVLAYLRQFTVNPQDIPESAPTAIPTDHDVDPTILAIQGDPEYGEYLSSECITCHQLEGQDGGVPSIVHWPEEDFVIAMQAYKTKKRPHPVMQMMASRLSDEEIASLAAYFANPE